MQLWKTNITKMPRNLWMPPMPAWSVEKQKKDEQWRTRTTSCKNVETLPRKNDLSCFKSLLVTSLWDILLTSLLPPIQSCSSKFWAWSCIASNFDKGWRGDHKHKSMDRPFMPKYGIVSQVLLQLVVAFLGVQQRANGRRLTDQTERAFYFCYDITIFI